MAKGRPNGGVGSAGPMLLYSGLKMKMLHVVKFGTILNKIH